MSKTDRTLAEWYKIWRAHESVQAGFRVCKEGCAEGWPCPLREQATKKLATAGVNPFAVRRGEEKPPQ